jgi:hypothetical protein
MEKDPKFVGPVTSTDLRFAVRAFIYVALGIAIAITSTRSEGGMWSLVAYLIIQGLACAVILTGFAQASKIGRHT